MDIRVLITDENNEVLVDLFIYQDGSDREGAEDIVSKLEENYSVVRDYFEPDEDYGRSIWADEQAILINKYNCED
jgi:hypothetical protein